MGRILIYNLFTKHAGCTTVFYNLQTVYSLGENDQLGLMRVIIIFSIGLSSQCGPKQAWLMRDLLMTEMVRKNILRSQTGNEQ